MIDSTERHRVLLLVDRLGQGGAARVVLNTALTLDRRSFSPVVCTTRMAPANGQDEVLRKAGVPVIELNRRSRLQLLSWKPLWQLLPGISILHAHESGSNLWGRLWGQLFHVPIIITQDHTSTDAKRRVVRLLDRVTSPLSDHIVTVSRYNRDLAIRCEKLPASRVVTIYNGVDVDAYSCSLSQNEARKQTGLPGERLLLVVIGRLVPEKNHGGLFEALTLLPEEVRSRTQCLVVGSGKLHSQLQNQVRHLGLNETVSFLGERSDVAALLRAVDVLVLPSHHECLPMVLLEALAARCPIVATSVGGVPEALDGLGWPVIMPSDSPGIARALADVLLMPKAERDRIAQAGREVVAERFSLETSIAQVEKLYHTALASTSPGALHRGVGVRSAREQS